MDLCQIPESDPLAYAVRLVVEKVKGLPFVGPKFCKICLHLLHGLVVRVLHLYIVLVPPVVRFPVLQPEDLRSHVRGICCCKKTFRERVTEKDRKVQKKTSGNQKTIRETGKEISGARQVPYL